MTYYALTINQLSVLLRKEDIGGRETTQEIFVILKVKIRAWAKTEVVGKERTTEAESTKHLVEGV